MNRKSAVRWLLCSLQGFNVKYLFSPDYIMYAIYKAHMHVKFLSNMRQVDLRL